MFEKSILN